MLNRERAAVVKLIKKHGPLTGLEVKKELCADSLIVWKACKTSKQLQVRTVGKRYLRLDRHVEGYARLSPSILREFFTYSVVGLADDPAPFEKKCAEVARRIHKISRAKHDLARRMVTDVMAEYEEGASRSDPICFIIAGDIVYDMAHDVPRPERSTGKLVRGSDIDLVVVVSDDLPQASIKRLDEIIYRKKYRMLIDPGVNEEVDYKIKRLERVRAQARFDDFAPMVAVKILQEGWLLHGDEAMFNAVKAIIRERGLIERLDELEKAAERFREKAERAILDGSVDQAEIKKAHLFYSAEEFEEFE